MAGGCCMALLPLLMLFVLLVERCLEGSAVVYLS